MALSVDSGKFDVRDTDRMTGSLGGCFAIVSFLIVLPAPTEDNLEKQSGGNAMKFGHITLLVALVTTAGCGSEAIPKVRFIVSNHIRGRTVDVYLDETAGQEVVSEDGVFHIQVPRTGVVRLRSLDPLTEPHVQAAVFEGGASIPAIDATKPDPKRVYWWPMGESVIDGSTTRLVYAIGRPDQVPSIDVFDRAAGNTSLSQ